jgi:hypothetical protein
MNHFIKDERKNAVVPPCFTRASRHEPYRVPTNPCAVTGAPVMDYLSPMRLQGHVQQALCTPSQLPGLSAAYLPAYSPYHCLLWYLFVLPWEIGFIISLPLVFVNNHIRVFFHGFIPLILCIFNKSHFFPGINMK